MATITLSITRPEGYVGLYKVEVSGSGFQGDVDKVVTWRLKGDDPAFDDEIFGPYEGGIITDEGTFYLTTNIADSNLNEDWGKDEIYALVKIGGLFESKSNVVSGYF
jgi:hypothetical protein